MARPRKTQDDELEPIDTTSGGLIEFLEDLELNDTRWRLNRAREGEPTQNGPWLESGSGELTEQGILERHGGGNYVLNVKRPGSEGWKRYAIPIEGPTLERNARISAATPAGSDTVAELRKQLEALRVEQEISRLRADLTRTAQPATKPLDELALLERLINLQRALAPARIESSGSPERLLDMFEKGMEAAARAEGHGDIAGVIREGLELARDMFGKRRAPETRGPSGIFTSPAIETEHELARFLERGIAKGTPADELADAADTIFADNELTVLRMASVEDLLGRLAPVLSAHPVLADPAARNYVAHWLDQLRVTPGDEGTAVAN